MTNGRRPGRPPKSNRSLSSAILAAAVQRFARMGFAETTLRDIAGDAKVDVALVAYQYGSKLGLWMKVVEAVGCDLLDHLVVVGSMNGARPAPDRLQAALSALLDYLVARPIVPQFILRDLSHDAEREAWTKDKVTMPVFDHLRALADLTPEPTPQFAGYRAFAIANFIYAAAGAVARRAKLAEVIPELAEDSAFRAALNANLINPVLDHV